MVILDKSGLKITFKLERPPNSPDQLVINMLAQNSGNTILTDFLFQVAVPKVRHIYNYIFTIIQPVYLSYIFLTDIPTTNVIAIEYCHSTVWSSNSSVESD